MVGNAHPTEGKHAEHARPLLPGLGDRLSRAVTVRRAGIQTTFPGLAYGQLFLRATATLRSIPIRFAHDDARGIVFVRQYRKNRDKCTGLALDRRANGVETTRNARFRCQDSKDQGRIRLRHGLQE